MYLDINESTLQPTLRALDSPGQRWMLSNPDSSTTATNAASTRTTSVSSQTITPTGSTSGDNPERTCDSGCPVTSPSPSAKKLLNGAIGGIAAGGAAALVLVAIGAFCMWRKRKNRAEEIK